MNNAVYYEYIDTVVNAHLEENGIESMRFVASSSCRYLRPFQYPQDVEVGLSVSKLGRSSVAYAIGIFSHPAARAVDSSTVLVAEATFVHVYVDADGKPMPIPPLVRGVLETLLRV